MIIKKKVFSQYICSLYWKCWKCFHFLSLLLYICSHAKRDISPAEQTEISLVHWITEMYTEYNFEIVQLCSKHRDLFSEHLPIPLHLVNHFSKYMWRR